MKYGVFILTENSPPYNEFDAIRREIFSRMNIPYLFVYNEPAIRATGKNDLIYLSEEKQENGIPMMFEKLVDAYKHVSRYEPWIDCNFIVRVNSSTFINYPVLEKILPNFPMTGCYAGSMVDNSFVSGTCIIFSPDTIKLLLRYIFVPAYIRSQTDDIIIGDIMFGNEIPLFNIPMFIIDDGFCPDDGKLKSVLSEYPLIRIRNKHGDRSKDIKIWEKLYSIYTA